ncbi:MAG TPA: hypothetical protein VK590_09405 [Saprospiraceae bacterium]|nr:hypothetical protein [Saprospiraceae bacterium]
MNLSTYPSQTLLKCFKWFNVLILIQLFSLSCSAQEIKDLACDHVNKLKNGTLIIVLETQSKRIALIERLIQKPGVSEKEKIRYQKLLSSELSYRDTSWYYTILGFKNLYKFSPIAFIMDTSLRCFLDHPGSCKYYDSSLNPINSNISGPVYIAQYGHIFENMGTNLTDAWYIMDSKMNRLSSPFPEQIKFSFFNPSFIYKLPKSFLQENHLSSVKAKHKPLVYAYKMDRLLSKYYKKAGRCD